MLPALAQRPIKREVARGFSVFVEFNFFFSSNDDSLFAMKIDFLFYAKLLLAAVCVVSSAHATAISVNNAAVEQPNRDMNAPTDVNRAYSNIDENQRVQFSCMDAVYRKLERVGRSISDAFRGCSASTRQCIDPFGCDDNDPKLAHYEDEASKKLAKSEMRQIRKLRAAYKHRQAWIEAHIRVVRAKSEIRKELQQEYEALMDSSEAYRKGDLFGAHDYHRKMHQHQRRALELDQEIKRMQVLVLDERRKEQRLDPQGIVSKMTPALRREILEIQ